MDENNILVLCPIFYDFYDLGNNKYHGEKEFIQARDFKKDEDITKGLYGILWGKVKNPYFKDIYKNIYKNKWAVVKTEKNENLIFVDKLKNRVKFKNGIILFIGNIKKSAQYICSLKMNNISSFSKKFKEIEEEDILGSSQWIIKQKNNRKYNLYSLQK